MPLSTLIGRDAAIQEIVARVRSTDTRLLTLTGPAGVGKTRLAIAAANALSEDFDRVYFVNLLAIDHAALVPAAVARALGVSESQSGDAAQRLEQFLRERPTLLVLDNFEHLLDAAPNAVRWLAASPELRIIVTSRITLRVTGEGEFAVPALSLPENEPDRAAGEAVTLFAERARAFNPRFDLNAENLPIVAEICRQLDALPLAIELAAARIRVFSPAALLSRIANRMSLLTGGSRDLPEHQRTMRDAIAWSYDLLAPDQRTLFNRIGVFAGSFAQGAMELVHSTGDARNVPPQQLLTGNTLSLEILDLSSTLVEQSLLAPYGEFSGDPRFAMLATIREFALERLHDSGEAPEIQRRHARYFLALAETGSAYLNSEHLGAWLNRLEIDYPNLVAAFEFLDSSGDVEGMARLAGALQQYWQTRGQFSEGIRWLERAIARAGDGGVPPRVVVDILHGSAWLAIGQGNDTAGRERAGESLRLARESGDRRGIARADSLLATVAFRAADYETALALHQESLAISREIGDDYGIGVALFRIALVTMELGELEASLSMYEEARAAFAAYSNEHGVGASIDNLGMALYCLGRYDEAEAAGAEALAIFRRYDDKRGVAVALDNLSRYVLRQGDAARAWSILEESLPLRRDLGDGRGIASWLESSALILTHLNNDRPAIAALAAADALRARLGTPLAGHEHRDHSEALGHLNRRLDPGEFALVWESGQTADVDTVIAETHQAALQTFANPGQYVPTRAIEEYGLSERELEVLAKLKLRLTDREIAEALFISPRTVARHVSSILAKLQVASRRDAAAMAE